MKITFMGVGSAFSRKNATSSILVESGAIKLLVDCGNPIPNSVEACGLSLSDITHIFITHLHADHIGGLEQMALMCRLFHNYRPKLLSTSTLLKRLWNCSLRGGLEYVEATPGDETPQSLDSYFDPIVLEPQQWISLEDEEPLQIWLHHSNHVKGLEAYSVELCEDPSLETRRILFTSDTRFNEPLIRYGVEACTYMFHDCQLFDSGENNHLGVHTSYNQLLGLPADIRQHLWLYHYGDSPLPNAKADGFSGFVEHFQTFVCE